MSVYCASMPREMLVMLRDEAAIKIIVFQFLHLFETSVIEITNVKMKMPESVQKHCISLEGNSSGDLLFMYLWNRKSSTNYCILQR